MTTYGLKHLFFQPILFHIITAKERFTHGYCVLRKSWLLEYSSAVRLRFSKLVIHVKGDMFVCMVFAVKLIPWNYHVCFASSVCFTRDLSCLKNNFAQLRQRLLLLSLKKVIHLFDWLFGLLSPMFSLCWLVIWGSGSGKRFKFSRPWWLKKEHILAIDQPFYLFLSWIFKLSISIVSEVLSHAIYQFHIVRNPNWRDNLCPTKICGWLTDLLRLTKESSRVLPCLRGRSTCSFPEQRLVIEPNLLTSQENDLVDERYDLFESRLALTQDLKLTEVLNKDEIR